MNAARKPIYSWETINEKRLLTLTEKSLKFLSAFAKYNFLLLNVIAFINYKIIQFLFRFLRAIFLSAPIVRLEKEEAWLFRSIK